MVHLFLMVMEVMIMGLSNFDVKNVVVLDWFGVIREVYPDVSPSNRADCEKKLNEILSCVRFNLERKKEAWEYTGRFILQASLISEARNYPHYNALKKQFHRFCKQSFTPDWVLPSGIFLDEVETVSGLMSEFLYEDETYAALIDGSFISLEPVLDQRFLDRYIKLEEQDEIREEANSKLNMLSKDLEYLEV